MIDSSINNKILLILSKSGGFMYNWKAIIKQITDRSVELSETPFSPKISPSESKFSPIASSGKKGYFTLSNLSELPGYDILAVDTETEGLERDCRLLGVSFCGEAGKAFWLSVNNFEPYDLWEALKGKYLIMHNSKFDMDVLARHGCDLAESQIFDTMIASHLLDENRSHKLKDLAETLLGESVIRFEDLSPQIDFNGESVTMEKYACADADYTFKLYQLFKPQLEAEAVDKLFYHVEMPLVQIILEMERTGIAIDSQKLHALSDEYLKEQKELGARIFDLANGHFNLNSSQQLQVILFEELKLPVTKKTKKGAPSTDNESLMSILNKHEIVPLILRWKELDKLLSTYIKKLPSHVENDNHIHCSFNQIGTETGRFSCSNPNLQNIPKDTTIRSAFVPAPGTVFIDADFSQIELRVIAHYTQDKKLLEAFKKDLDVHTQTAARVLNKPIDGITKDERSFGKTLNFALCYGMGASTFSKRTGYSLGDATRYRNSFFQTYPILKKTLYEYSKEAEQNGYIQNMFGRRRRFNSGENTFMAFNSLIQGTAGDICKIALVHLSKTLPEYVKMLLIVHDEIIFELPKENAESVKQLILDTMQRKLKGTDGKEFTVPIKADAGIGENWANSKG